MRGNFPPGVTELMIPGNEPEWLVECGQCGASIRRSESVRPEFEGITEEWFCDAGCFAAWIAEHADEVADYLIG